MGKRTSFTKNADEHTMIVNMDKAAGYLTAIVWDGLLSRYSRGGAAALAGTFSRGNKRIEVLVYGGHLPKQTIINLLTAWMGGKWVKMTLDELAGGAAIPKHRL
jgi:hypothetical protein